MSILICPVCGDRLSLCDNSYKCNKNHSFDISKKGYVNLLMSNASGEKRHGDDKSMAVARRDFLNRGYYLPLADEISKIASDTSSETPVVFECGCGECYYINEVKKSLHSTGKSPVLYGGDISKEVLPFGKKRVNDITLFVASAFKLPLLPESVDVAMSVFAPMDLDEFSRIVKKGGMVIKAIPLEKHLIELKEELYDNVYLNRPVIETHDSFVNESCSKLEYKFTLSTREEIDVLFKMTPYYYKTGAKAQEKISKLNELTITASFGISKYVKK